MPRWFQSSLAIAASICITGLFSPSLTRAESTQSEAQSQIRETLGVVFAVPNGFSDVKRLSRQTRGIVYPKNAEDSPQIVIRFAELETNPDNWVQFNSQEELGYAKYLLLGGNPPSEELTQRIFLGKPLKGESQTRRSRNGFRYTEIYVISLEESGRKLAVAFDADTLVPVQTVENAINTVSQSLKEIPSKKKKKRKKKKQQAQAQAQNVQASAQETKRPGNKAPRNEAPSKQYPVNNVTGKPLARMRRVYPSPA